MPYHMPERLCEQALRLYIQTIGGNIVAGLQILTRFESTKMTEPCLLIYCDRAEPQGMNSEKQVGNWTCALTLELRTHYEDHANLQHDEFMGEVSDILLTDSFVSELNTISGELDVTFIQATIGERTNEVDGATLVTKQAINIMMMPSKAS